MSPPSPMLGITTIGIGDASCVWRPRPGSPALSDNDGRGQTEAGDEIDNGASSLQPQGDFPRRPAHHLPTCPLPEMPTGRLGRYLGSTVPVMAPGPVSPCHRSRNARLSGRRRPKSCIPARAAAPPLRCSAGRRSVVGGVRPEVRTSDIVRASARLLGSRTVPIRPHSFTYIYCSHRTMFATQASTRMGM